MDEFCQRAILLVVLAILVWAPIAMAGVRLVDFAPIEGLTAVALGLWVVRFWTQRPFRLFWPPVCWIVYGFVAYGLVRAQFVPVPFVAHRELVQVVVYGVLFLVIANNLNHRRSAEIVTTTLIVLGMALSFLAIYQFATNSQRVSIYHWALKPAIYYNRGSGTFINPNNFAGWLEMLIPLGVAYVLLSRMSAVAKVFIAYATVMMVAGLCVTVSRGAMVATVAALALLCIALMFEGGYILPSVLALVLIFAVAVGVRQNFGAVERRFDRGESTSQVDLGHRKNYWEVAAKIFDDHKVWGAGPAQFDQQFFLYRPEWMQIRLTYAHNEYMNTLADWGAVGLGIIVAFLGVIYYGAWRAWHGIRRKMNDIGSRQTDKGAFLLGGAFGLAAAVFHCFIDFDMHVPADALLAVALLALLAAHGRYVTERYWKNPGEIGRVIMAVGAAAVAVCLTVSGVRLWQEQRWVERADEDQRILMEPLDPKADPETAVNSPERRAAFQDRIASLGRAYEADPTDAVVSFNLGECYWDLGAQADLDYQRDTLEAMKWYSRAMAANPLNSRAWLQYGVCLDWLDRHEEAGFYFDRANKIDPSDWYVTFCTGKHLVELDQLAKARDLFMLAYYRTAGAAMPMEYVKMVDSRLAEEAARK